MPSAKHERLDLYLVPAATQLWHRDEGRGSSRLIDSVPPDAIRLAPLVVDEEGNGTAEFVVPEVEPGAYVLVVSCPMCNFSASEHLAPVADFVVTQATQHAELAATGLPVWSWAAGAALLLLAGLLLGRMCPTERS